MHGCQANKKTHLCVASSIRAMPENETPVIRVDIYDLSYCDNLVGVKHMSQIVSFEAIAFWKKICYDIDATFKTE